MRSEFEVTPSGLPIPVDQLSVESTLRERYWREVRGGLGKAVWLALIAFSLLLLYPVSVFRFGHGLPGWPWAFSSLGATAADVLVASVLVGLPALQIAGAVDRRVGPTRLKLPLLPSAALLGVGVVTNRPVGLVLGLVASLVVANIVLRKEFARLAAIDPAELRVAPKTSRLGYMSRSETAIAVVALVLVGGFSTMHPLGQNRGWIGGGTNADVRVKGVPMRKAHFINGFIDNGFLHLTITKVKPEGVDPRLIYVGTEFADDAIDFRRTVPFHPVRTERSISASFFLNFGVRGCTAGSPAGSALRSVQPFKKVVIEYTVGGRRHSMTFAGARSATPAGFDLCK